MTDSREESAWERKSGDLGKVGMISSAPCQPLGSAAPSSPSVPDHPASACHWLCPGTGAPLAYLDGAGDVERRFHALYVELQHTQILTAQRDGAGVTRDPGDGTGIGLVSPALHQGRRKQFYKTGYYMGRGNPTTPTALALPPLSVELRGPQLWGRPATLTASL